MKINKNILILSMITAVICAGAIVVAVKAATGGSLTPPGTAVSGTNPVGTMHTLDDIYNAIPTIDPATVVTGTTILGVAGTAPKSITWQPYDGKCSVSTTTFCAQNSDCLSGQTCNVISLSWNNSSCGTCPGVSCNCTSLNGGLIGATEYCAHLDANGNPGNLDSIAPNIWRLPTEGELLKGLSKGYIENSDGGGFQDGGYYWSSIPLAGGPGNALFAFDCDGLVFSGYGGMINQYLVRCVK